MLSRSAPIRRRWWSALLAVMAIVAGSLLLTPAPVASAGGINGFCQPPQVFTFEYTSNNSYGWACINPGSGGGGGDGEPLQCDLEDPYNYCDGTSPCYDTPAAPPPGETPPEPGWQYELTTCLENGVPVVFPDWDPPPGGSEVGFPFGGRLPIPPFEVRVSPAALSYVGAETKFWVEWTEDPHPPELVHEDFGFNVIATPRHLEITPGDGSPMFTCPPWPTGPEDDCMWKYDKTSIDSAIAGPNGLPSFRAEAVLVYDVRWEDADTGTPFDPPLPPPPDFNRSEPQTVDVPVGEIQALVE